MPETTANYGSTWTPTENGALISTAQQAVQPTKVEEGLYLTRGGDGRHHIEDLRDQIQAHKATPTRKTGKRTVTSFAAFAGYLAKHGVEATELWGSRDQGVIKAVINAHDGDPDPEGPVSGLTPDGQTGTPGWEDHTVTLQQRFSDDWKEWTSNDGKYLPQAEFAEFIEDHTPAFGKPTAAEMLELAQSFRATTNSEFGSSQRLKDGQTALTYVETIDAKAGPKGTLAIPDRIEIALPVYDQGAAYPMTARLRYRITGGHLVMGYRLDRPKDVLQRAFNDVIGEVERSTGRTVWDTP